VDPFDEICGPQCPEAGRVAGEVGVVEHVAPLAGRAATEAGFGVDPVLPIAVGDQLVGSVAHRFEGRGPGELRPPVLLHDDVEPRGQVSHPSFQIALQVVEVQEHDVEIVGRVPEGRQMFDGAT
jgi:hypothetical protein